MCTIETKIETISTKNERNSKAELQNCLQKNRYPQAPFDTETGKDVEETYGRKT